MSPKPYEQLSTKEVYRSPYWSIHLDTYMRPDGQVGDYHYPDLRDSVVVIPVRSDGQVVLVEQFRYLVQAMRIEFPGGGRKADQSPEDAARAELIEETGYEAISLEHLVRMDTVNGTAKGYADVFLARLGEQGEQQLEPTEEITLKTYTPKEFEAKIAGGEIGDSFTLAAWALARSRNLI